MDSPLHRTCQRGRRLLRLRSNPQRSDGTAKRRIALVRSFFAVFGLGRAVLRLASRGEPQPSSVRQTARTILARTAARPPFGAVYPRAHRLSTRELNTERVSTQPRKTGALGSLGPMLQAPQHLAQVRSFQSRNSSCRGLIAHRMLEQDRQVGLGELLNDIQLELMVGALDVHPLP